VTVYFVSSDAVTQPVCLMLFNAAVLSSANTHSIHSILSVIVDALTIRSCYHHTLLTLQVIDQYGADALRLYLIDSPVVRAEPLRFREAGVLSVVKDVLLPWFNTLRFFTQQVSDCTNSYTRTITVIDAT
jgi:hypothetical protein